MYKIVGIKLTRKAKYLKKKLVAVPHFWPQNSQEMDRDLHPELCRKTPPANRMKNYI